MHKKLFIAVLALGLLLASVPAIADDVREDLDGSRPVGWSGSGVSKAGFTPALGAPVSTPLVTVNAGQNRTVPGVFCDGQYQGPLTYGINNWYYQSEFYAGYQDPSDPTRFGAVCSNSPSFDVTAINTILGNTVGPFPFTFVIQPLVLAVVSPSATAPCTQEPAPVAGGASCTGPLYSVTWTAGGFFLINLPFALECCQPGPYYAAWYSGTYGYTTIRIGTDGGSPGGHAAGANYCSQWNDYGTGWIDMDQFWEAAFGPGFDLTHLTWSEGYTPDDLATHCNPGVCGCQHWYNGVDVAVFGAGGCESFGGSPGVCRNDCWSRSFSLPSALGIGTGAEGTGGTRVEAGVAFEAIGLDTVKSIGFRITQNTFCPTSSGIEDTAAFILRVYDDAGPLEPCGRATPGALVYSTPVPKSLVVYDPFVTEVSLPDITWGTLNGGPKKLLFVTLEFDPVNATQPNDCVVMASGDPAAFGCASPTHTIERVTGVAGGPWFWINQRPNLGGVRELWMDAEVCQEVLPAQETPCLAGADDEWTGFAHDNQQTSASSIDVGDPLQILGVWNQPHATNSNFANPTVANDIVYYSSDDQLNAYDLSTGAPVGTASGSPEMSVSQNRANTTVAFVTGLPFGPDRDVVLATGGTFASISAWELDLETSGPSPIWSRNSGNSLTQQQRFNTCKVVDNVVYIVTEPSTGTGRLWAIDAGTGGLYAGWPTNPLRLDAAAKHGPAISYHAASGRNKLIIGTAIGGSNIGGSIYSIDALSGDASAANPMVPTAPNWIFNGVVAGEGFPSGVSAEGDFIYAASKHASGGQRYKIDVSGLTPTTVWTFPQGTGLYGTPTIGRDFVYYPLDNPSFGLLQVDKDIGTVARNFGTEELCGTSLFMVPCIATLSCDAYLFAGDRNGLWWLFNAVTGEPSWYKTLPGAVQGTALATSAVTGFDYAVVGTQFGGPGGIVAAFRLNAGPRPFLIQCKFEETVTVPIGSGFGTPHPPVGQIDDVFLNVGANPLNFTGLTVTDPPPEGLAAARKDRAFRAGLAAAAHDFDGYTTIATPSTLTKRHRIAGLSTEMIDGEMPASMLSNDLANAKIRNVRSSSRATAASASAIRTDPSSVRLEFAPVPTSIASGGSAGLSWSYDGTGLGRGLDAEDLEFNMNDPDYNFDGSDLAIFHILYVGGCQQDQTWISWNLDGANANAAKVFNHGTFCDQGADAMIIGDDPTSAGDDQRWEGGVLLAGDSSAAIGGAQLAIDYYFFEEYVPNPNPAGDCGFEKDSGLVLGAKRTGGCPGTPTAIHGAYVKTYYADSNLNVAANSPLAAMGINVEETEVGADDPLYGDFILTRMVFINRDATAKTVRAGTYFDWDINTNASNNVGYISDGFNGYAIWDPDVTHFAYGALDVHQPSSYGGVDPTAFPPAMIMCNLNDTTYGGLGDADWVGNHYPDDWQYGWWLASGKYAGPRHTMGGNGVAGMAADRGGFLVNSLNLAGNGSGEVVQAQFAFNIAGNSNDAFAEASGQGIAKRAARWAGFARGDVNDDGVVDLADVMWLQSALPVYPADYSGDVNASGGAPDAADIARLLSYVSGNAGDAPAGAWRFPW